MIDFTISQDYLRISQSLAGTYVRLKMSSLAGLDEVYWNTAVTKINHYCIKLGFNVPFV